MFYWFLLLGILLTNFSKPFIDKFILSILYILGSFTVNYDDHICVGLFLGFLI